MLPGVPGHVFISYARGDRPYVDRLAQYLTDAGFGVWYDRSLEPGSSFSDKIRAALEASDAVIVVLSPDSVASKWVLREISYADQRKIPLVPLLLADCAKPMEVAALQHHDVRGGRMVDSNFVNSLSRLAPGRSLPDEGPRHATVRRPRRWILAAAALAVLVAGGIGTYLALRETGPQVIVSKGTPCGDGIGATQGCAGGHCIYEACAYIHVETVGFEGQVPCQFSTGDPEFDAAWRQNDPWGPNESKDSGNWFGLAGQRVTVTCGGVTGGITWS
jgi:hypothetical protein